jgi:outer membrane protein OmpA-like peptidoglycan-associated protein
MTCRARVACLLAVLLALGGCSSQSWSSINPINWWHGLEGGAIAQQRPPPPGANQPDPNLASVPPTPEQPDRAALQNIADALVADRANAQRMAAAAPLGDPSSPSASPDLFGVGTTPPPGPAPAPGAAPAASATLPAANAPPAPPSSPAPAQTSAQPSAPVTPPVKAPVGAVASNSLPEPTPPPAPLSVGPTLPPLPTAPPVPANVTGMPAAPAAPRVAAAPTPAAPPVVPAPAPPAAVSPPATPAPAAASVSPPVAAPTPPPRATATPAPAAKPAPTALASRTPSGEPETAGNTVAVIFANGVAQMPPSAATLLRTLAGKRGNGLIAVTGYGDAADASPDTQAAALKLGLARAQAIASALVADGVPASAVQIDAQAMGRGGTARLVR